MELNLGTTGMGTIGFFGGTLVLTKILPALITLIICILGIKIALKLFEKLMSKAPIDATLYKFSVSAVKALLYFVAVLIVADSLGIQVTSLLAVFSMLGLAVSLSVQGSLSNLASGVLMLVSKPFVAGDFVEAGGIMGTVKEVGLIYTTIATVDNKIIYVPNSEMSAGKIINYSTEDLRRVDLNFTASYDSPVENVKAALLKAVKDSKVFLDEPAVFVNVFAYNDSNIEYVVRAWTKTENYWDGYFALLENVKKTFDESGVEMTYNHLNVHMVKE